MSPLFDAFESLFINVDLTKIWRREVCNFSFFRLLLKIKFLYRLNPGILLMQFDRARREVSFLRRPKNNRMKPGKLIRDETCGPQHA